MNECIKIKKHYKDKYTTIDNQLINDMSISFKAKGVFLYFWSKPDDWELKPKAIAEDWTDRQTVIYSALKELEEAGYLYRKRYYINGKIAGINYNLSDTKGFDDDLFNKETLNQENLNQVSQDEYIYIQKKETNKRNNELNKKYKKEKSFTKPSKEEIQEYITQENLLINAEQVLSYYDSTNWVKKNGKPVVNWKSTIKNWNRPTIAERKIDIENISFEVKEKSKNHTPYEKLQKIIMNKGISRNDSEIKNILQMEECQQWLEQTESNKTFEATLEDIQTHPEAQNVLKNAYISFLEKFRTSREQIDNDIQNRLPLFLTRCEKLRYTAVIEGLTTITKNDYNNYMKKQSENKLPFISHFDYIIQRIEFIDSEITRLWKKVNELLV